MKKRHEWWLRALLVLSVAIVGGMLVSGCELFGWWGQQDDPPPPPPAANDEDDQSEDKDDESEADVVSVEGKWEGELRTNGTKSADVELDLTQDGDDVGGTWSIPPYGGSVDGEIDDGDDVDLDLESGGDTIFNLEGDVKSDGDEIKGDWTRKDAAPAELGDGGSWEVERD